MKRKNLLPLITVTIAIAAATPGAASSGDRHSSRQIREINKNGYRIRLDLGTQVLRLSVPEDIYYSGGFERGDDISKKEEAKIIPTLAEASNNQFISASLLAQKAKQFDDGLYAAVDLAAQQGAGAFGGKASLLSSLVQCLAQSSAAPPAKAVVTIASAGKIGRPELELPRAYRKPVQQAIDEFNQDELRSKPIGFYTWNDQLGAIFRQDRMLQNELKGKSGIAAIVKALHGNKNDRAVYEGYLQLVSGLTNPRPPEYQDLRKQLAAFDHGNTAVPDWALYFFPPSRSHETELVKKLFGKGPIPENFNLVDEMVRRIQAGQLQLRPTKDSGWYDYQTWSLEPLVIPNKMPEAAKLHFDDSYLKQLLELFKGILALTRETHIKQLEIPRAGAFRDITIHIYPELSAEPLASYYYRRAHAYLFVRRVLEEIFGAAALEKMHRLTAAGFVPPTLAEELLMMENLFYGAHVKVSRQLGMIPTISPYPGTAEAGDAAVAVFDAWQRRLSEDPDLGTDSRMMVPLFYDMEKQRTKVWVFMGWAEKPLDISFAVPPAATIFDENGRPVTDGGPELAFKRTRRALFYPVTAEVYVGRLLNRDEFRAHCDRYKKGSAIINHLE